MSGIPLNHLPADLSGQNADRLTAGVRGSWHLRRPARYLLHSSGFDGCSGHKWQICGPMLLVDRGFAWTGPEYVQDNPVLPAESAVRCILYQAVRQTGCSLAAKWWLFRQADWQYASTAVRRGLFSIRHAAAFMLKCALLPDSSVPLPIS